MGLDADRRPVTPFSLISIMPALLEASARPGSGCQLTYALGLEFKLFSRLYSPATAADSQPPDQVCASFVCVRSVWAMPCDVSRASKPATWL